MSEVLQQKYAALQENLRQLASVAVAFSSGVDSTFLLKVAHNVLGSGVLAVTARSCIFPQRELNETVEFTRRHGIGHIILDFDELEIDGFSANLPNRCYLCKRALFRKIRSIADARGIQHIAEGSNVDDGNDYRPGKQAVQELGIISPLRQANLGKQEIRQLSQQLDLPTWDKQSFACLSSRFCYGDPITREGLKMIDLAEQFLLDKGFHQVRVRFHGILARIETDESGFQLLCDSKLREQIYAEFQRIGFRYTALDLFGYRTGSMNETLERTGN